MNDPTVRQMYAKAIGELAVSYLENSGSSVIASFAQSRALTAIFHIKTILDNQNLNETESYGYIKTIVEKFYSEGFSVPRHY